jgi:hypothetical protein
MLTSNVFHNDEFLHTPPLCLASLEDKLADAYLPVLPTSTFLPHACYAWLLSEDKLADHYPLVLYLPCPSYILLFLSFHPLTVLVCAALEE